MSKLSALGHLGLAFEATFGTTVPAVAFIPYESIKVGDEIKKVDDDARRAVLTKTFHTYNATRQGSVEIDTDVYPEYVGYLLKSILSNYLKTGVAAPYTHTFTVLNALSPSLTLTDNNTITQRNYAGAIMSELSFKFDTESVMKMSAKFISKSSVTTTTATPNFIDTNPFMGFQAQLTLGGSSNVNLVGGDLSIKRESKLLFTANNTQDATKYSTGRIEASGKLTFDIEDETEFMNYINGTQQTMTLTFTRDANTQITFSFGKVDFTKANIDRSQEFLRCDVDYKALFNVTDNGMITVTVKNSVPTF